MKAIIPVAGAGTHLRPHTYTQPKPLIPVAGKPIIAHIIDDLQDAGVHDFVFVLGHLGDKIRHYIERTYHKLKIDFVVQSTRRGLGHAIYEAREKVRGESEIIIFLGDTIIQADLKAMFSAAGSILAVKKVDDPRKFGVVEIGENGIVEKLFEKPPIPKSNLALVGVYKITDAPLLLHALDQNISKEVKTHDEFQLTDALMGMIEQGHEFQTVTVDNWFDCGRKDILLETNAILLDKLDSEELSEFTHENSIIIPPIRIGQNSQIVNSIIGPHVTIGENSRIEESLVKNSIIGHFTTIFETVLQNSVIGNDASIRGLKHSLNIGDNTEIDFS